MTCYDETKTDDVAIKQEQSFNQFITHTYLDSAEKAKYGTLLTGLHTQT
jgi:hypothetical protein